ncbi:MAG TPA: methyl-accepting chemotaxis protein, partial [Colwellia sp.]|nr:methyl-accepting chemotaxis protein [Colwellia sp.]
MNLTVAVKIIGGFAIISILLIVISTISLSNLDTISESTQQQNTLAIPTLKASNKLALELSKMSNLALKGYYQGDLGLLAGTLREYKNIEDLFTERLSALKQIVASEQDLLTNLTQVDQLYSSFNNANLGLFNSHKISIEQKQLLTDKIDILEVKADDTVMLLLDLADHELADSKLQRAISLSEQLENQFNSIVSSAFEYRDIIDESTAQLIESELSRSLDEAK